MKVELIGECHERSTFWPRRHIRWDIWLDKEYTIASGHSRNEESAIKAANKAFKRFQKAINRVGKLSYSEWL